VWTHLLMAAADGDLTLAPCHVLGSQARPAHQQAREMAAPLHYNVCTAAQQDCPLSSMLRFMAVHLMKSATAAATVRNSCTPAAMVRSPACGSDGGGPAGRPALCALVAIYRLPAYTSAENQVRKRHRSTTLCFLLSHATTCMTAAERLGLVQKLLCGRPGDDC